MGVETCARTPSKPASLAATATTPVPRPSRRDGARGRGSQPLPTSPQHSGRVMGRSDGSIAETEPPRCSFILNRGGACALMLREGRLQAGSSPHPERNVDAGMTAPERWKSQPYPLPAHQRAPAAPVAQDKPVRLLQDFRRSEHSYARARCEPSQSHKLCVKQYAFSSQSTSQEQIYRLLSGRL